MRLVVGTSRAQGDCTAPESGRAAAATKRILNDAFLAGSAPARAQRRGEGQVSPNAISSLRSTGAPAAATFHDGAARAPQSLPAGEERWRLFGFSRNARRRSARGVPANESKRRARLSSLDGTHRVSVEEYRSSEVLFEARASSSNNAILTIHRSSKGRDPGDRDADEDHGAFANTSENQLERALSCGAHGAELC